MRSREWINKRKMLNELVSETREIERLVLEVSTKRSLRRK
jgi:hypothetical protein